GRHATAGHRRPGGVRPAPLVGIRAAQSDGAADQGGAVLPAQHDRDRHALPPRVGGAASLAAAYPLSAQMKVKRILLPLAGAAVDADVVRLAALVGKPNKAQVESLHA